MESKKKKIKKSFTFDGKRYWIRGDTLEEVLKKEALKLRDLEEGRIIISGSMTVAQWAERCISVYKPNLSDNYRSNMMLRIKKHILSVIGSMQVKQVKPLMCQEILNNQAGMSKSHITKVHQELCFIFEKAVENHLILDSPAKNLTRPKGTQGKRRSLTDNERKHLLLVCSKNDRFLLFLLMLYCGCRPAEAIRARGMDITTLEGLNVLHIRGTKTENADRYVPIPDDFYERIKNTPPFEPICPNTAGREHSEGSYDRLVENLKRELNLSMGARTYRNKLIPPFPLATDFVPYILRHTYCTDLQKKGVDVRAAQKLMGHADISTTANIYTHQDNETLLQAAAAMGITINNNSPDNLRNIGG